MRWPTHQVGAMLGAALLGLSTFAVFAAMFGGIMPDVIDQKRAALALSAKGRQKIFNRTHRGASHWLGWWLLLFLLCTAIPQPFVREVAAGFLIGACSHIALDMLTPRGVPLLPVTRKGSVSLRFGSTGSWREYILLTVMTIGLLVVLCLRYNVYDLLAG